jgi:hypothetical protein
MEKDLKDILLKDLCGRLPHGVKAEKYTIRIDGEIVPHASIEVVTAKDIITQEECPGYTIKPYLFPLSSMTGEQKREYVHIATRCGTIASSLQTGMTTQDWFDKNHLDYRGLIPMGMAIDATDKNIYKNNEKDN